MVAHPSYRPAAFPSCEFNYLIEPRKEGYLLRVNGYDVDYVLVRFELSLLERQEHAVDQPQLRAELDSFKVLNAWYRAPCGVMTNASIEMLVEIEAQLDAKWHDMVRDWEGMYMRETALGKPFELTYHRDNVATGA